jgi:AmmeMemoRadiSam system protein A
MASRILESERQELLRLARFSIHEAIEHDGSLKRVLEQARITPGMRIRRGLFVTLKSHAGDRGQAQTATRLRGCIGTMYSDRPLYETVIDTAPKAALEDPRFPPLTRDELDALKISLSVLSPMKRLADVSELVIGRDGLQLVKGARRSVFLPQVPVEQLWDQRRYLEQLALKAGLHRDGWRGAELSTFEAESFGE